MKSDEAIRLMKFNRQMAQTRFEQSGSLDQYIAGYYLGLFSAYMVVACNNEALELEAKFRNEVLSMTDARRAA